MLNDISNNLIKIGLSNLSFNTFVYYPFLIHLLFFIVLS